MELEELKESVADALADGEVKEAIKEEIETVANDKAQMLLDKEKEQLEEEFNQRLQEEVEAAKEKIEEKYAKALSDEISRLNDRLTLYADKVVANFIHEHTEDFKMYEDKLKIESVLEGLKTVMAIAGVHTQEVIECVETRNAKMNTMTDVRVKNLQEQLNQIHEENNKLKTNLDLLENERATLTDSINSMNEENKNLKAELKNSQNTAKGLIKENKNLNRENADVVRMGVISELKNGLTLLESKKFEKMAMNIPFSATKDYVLKLKELKESIQDTSLNEVTKVKEEIKTEETSNYRKFV